MTEESKPKRKRYATPDRANLSKDALAIVNSWVDQVKPKLAGSKITRSDLVNWVVEKKGETLSGLNNADMGTQ